MYEAVEVDGIKLGKGLPLVLIAGPCVIEDLVSTMAIAISLKKIADELELPLIFKASYDKANRTSLKSYRGPGLEKGLDILSTIKAKVGVPVLSDIHQISEVESAARVLDVLQIPAFLCRQTDFILAVSETGKPVNVKKGQFLAPWDMAQVVDKIVSAGNRKILLTERGTSFGYNNLVVDFRSFSLMHDIGWPVIFDATHSVQLPGGLGSASGGQRQFVPMLARAAVAAGADGIFMEVHENPDLALCDGPNSLALSQIRSLLKQLKSFQELSYLS